MQGCHWNDADSDIVICDWQQIDEIGDDKNAKGKKRS
jgi:hypothetical protein